MSNGKEDTDDIVASHQALGVVAGWLGMSAEDAFEEAGPGTADIEKPRPQFLGLGAKYLPHHKAVAFTAALDNRLKKRLENGRKRRADEDEQGHPLRAGHHTASITQHGQDRAVDNQQGSIGTSGNTSDSDDGEEKGRAAQLGSKARGAMLLGKVHREQLLLAAPEDHGNKKRKKKHKQTASGQA